uniref:ERCC4 domain-containing protein n=1 Tax=Proboscia inermis TaxID=420281 RepID=A0A7S0GHP4_9STRA
MPPPLNCLDISTQEVQEAISSGGRSSHHGTYANGMLPLSVDTRTGRGKQTTKNTIRRDIAVDVREFRSALPSILHQGGMRLAPVTLIVGDFVLSPVHCVERKSISDLFGSFASGRLYTQAEAMTKYYKCPCLLIDFDPSKSFCLQNSNELGGEIRVDSVCSKMAILTMHFPKLRILWSRGPHQTLAIFKTLKMKHEEVNIEKSISVGNNESLDGLMETSDVVGGGSTVNSGVENNTNSNKDEENEINEAARDMLLRLPGINVNNARKLMAVCDSIAELTELPRDDLKKLLGPVTGQKLFTFLNQKLAAS